MQNSAILSAFIKLAIVIKIFVLSIFEWPFHTGFIVYRKMYEYSKHYQSLEEKLTLIERCNQQGTNLFYSVLSLVQPVRASLFFFKNFILFLIWAST